MAESKHLGATVQPGVQPGQQPGQQPQQTQTKPTFQEQQEQKKIVDEATKKIEDAAEEVLKQYISEISPGLHQPDISPLGYRPNRVNYPRPAADGSNPADNSAVEWNMFMRGQDLLEQQALHQEGGPPRPTRYKHFSAKNAWPEDNLYAQRQILAGLMRIARGGEFEQFERAEINRGFAELVKDYVPKDLLDYHDIDPTLTDYWGMLWAGFQKKLHQTYSHLRTKTDMFERVRDVMIDHITKGKVNKWLEDQINKAEVAIRDEADRLGLLPQEDTDAIKAIKDALKDEEISQDDKSNLSAKLNDITKRSLKFEDHPSVRDFAKDVRETSKIGQKRYDNSWIRYAGLTTTEITRPRGTKDEEGKGIKRIPVSVGTEEKEETETIDVADIEEGASEQTESVRSFLQWARERNPLVNEWLEDNPYVPFKDHVMDAGLNPRTDAMVQNGLLVAAAVLWAQGYDKQEIADFLGYTSGRVSRVFRELGDLITQYAEEIDPELVEDIKRYKKHSSLRTMSSALEVVRNYLTR